MDGVPLAVGADGMARDDRHDKIATEMKKTNHRSEHGRDQLT